MKTLPTLVVAVAAALLLTGSPPALAATEVFYDDFEDGNRDGWFNVDTDASLLTVKHNTEAPASTARLNGGDPNGEMQMLYGNSDTVRVAVTYFAPVTLNQAGEYIELSLKAVHGGIGAGGNTFGEGFRFGLYDSMGTKVTADGDLDDTTAITDDDGYFAAVDTAISTIADSAELHEQATSSGDSPLETGSDNRGRFANDDNDGDPDRLMFSANDFFTFRLRITLNALGGLDVVLSNNEAPVGSGDELIGTIASPTVTTFDTLYLGLFNVDDIDVRIDDVLITTNVPTPAAGVMGMVGLLALASRRRARRR